MKNPLEQQPFLETFFWVAIYSCLLLVTLYLVTIVWLTITHIWSIGKFLTQYISATAKLWIQRFFGKKDETLSSSMVLELSDLEIPLNSTTEKEIAPQTCTPPKSVQAKKRKSSNAERG
jgi:amino acid permease